MRYYRAVLLVWMVLLSAVASALVAPGAPGAPPAARADTWDPSPEEIDYAVERALDYPYEDVPESYLFVNGKAYTYKSLGRDAVRDAVIDTGDGKESTVEAFLRRRLDSVGGTLPPGASQRTAVIGYGSNKAPSALAQKYDGKVFPRGWAVIPVIKATLTDFEVTHAAHYYGNGNLPATVQYAKGARSEVFLTLLDDEELRRMHATEGLDENSPRSWYHFAKLSGLSLTPHGGAPMREAHVYIDNYGTAAVDGRTYALEKVHGTPVSPRASQEEIQNLTQPVVASVQVSEKTQRTCQGYAGIRGFVCATFVEPCVRASRTEVLMAQARPFGLPAEAGVGYQKVAGSTTAGNPDIYKGPRCASKPDIG
ncbi:hypothetical protein [Actinomadura fibrosa]|uniref:Uncharacterized protein n=1 Tax=Actinomadura fibrosa TaxID=111802 RepID=A0ABW2XKV6_9ACTN|nr:hypothetical protein [Actinomadura fibrosa]